MSRVVVAALVVAAGLTTTAVASGAADACSAPATKVLSGAQPRFTTTLNANDHVDANAATWAPSTTLPYPVYFDANSNSCWEGGRITGTFPVGTTWRVYHDTAGIGVIGPAVAIDHPRVFNVGDGIRIRDNADNFRVEDAYLSYIHDDCVENDDLFNGTITNSFLDGCYVAFSTRRADTSTADGHLNTETISNSLVRLQAMPTVYSGTAAGHGGFFKWDTSSLRTSPKLAITNTVFRADQTTNHQDLNLPAGYSVTCSNNTMVWLGPGAFPGSLPSCFTVTTDRSVWDSAVRTWEAAHPGVVTGPEVSVGDASVDEGTTGARTMRFPVTLSSPPGTGRSVTVYWSTAPGNAGSSDFKSAKGKLVFTGSQVLKTVAVPILPDGGDEANELMYVVAAGVDGGENHRERGTGTIIDDDPGSGVGLFVSDASTVEGDAGTRTLVVPVTLTQPAGADVMVHYSTVAGTATAGADYTTKTGTVKIAKGARQVTLSIPVLPDTTAEGTETFSIVVDSAPNATIVKGTGTVTIRDDD